jgi:serine/threonine protein kinase
VSAAGDAQRAGAGGEATVEWDTGGWDTAGSGAGMSTRVIRATPRWLAPEQIAGRPLDGRTDVFALGALLVFLSTGRSPFGAGPAAEVIRRVVQEQADLGGVDTTLVPLAAACLAKDPQDRPSAADVAFELRPSGTAGRRAA